MAKDLTAEDFIEKAGDLSFINEDGFFIDPLMGTVTLAEKDAKEIIYGIHAAGFLCDRRKRNLKIADKNNHNGKKLYELWCDLVDLWVTNTRGTKQGSLAAQFPTWEAEPESLVIRI